MENRDWRRPLDVWYLCDQMLCNFDCSYCVTSSTRTAAGKKVWATVDGPVRYRRVLNWLADLDVRLRVRLSTNGEPFVSKDFLAGAARLSHAENLEFLEIVTNASYTKRQFLSWVESVRVERLSVWATYHPTEIALDRFVEACRVAQDAGAFVVAHAILFPDNLDTFEALVESCQDADITIDTTMGINMNGQYPEQGHVPLAETHPDQLPYYHRHPAALQAVAQAVSDWNGRPCSAGHDYIRIDEKANIYRCGPYALIGQEPLGNVLDPDLSLELREAEYAPCRAHLPCICKEDYFHLEAARSELSFPKSLGYYELPVLDE